MVQLVLLSSFLRKIRFDKKLVVSYCSSGTENTGVKKIMHWTVATIGAWLIVASIFSLAREKQRLVEEAKVLQESANIVAEHTRWLLALLFCAFPLLSVPHLLQTRIVQWLMEPVVINETSEECLEKGEETQQNRLVSFFISWLQWSLHLLICFDVWLLKSKS